MIKAKKSKNHATLIGISTKSKELTIYFFKKSIATGKFLVISLGNVSIIVFGTPLTVSFEFTVH